MDAYSYIADRAKQDKEIINNYQEIIEYFGKNPMCLSAAMDFITEDRHILEQISSNSLGMLDSTYYFRKIKSLLEKYVRRSTKAYRHLLYLITFFDGNLKIEFLKHMDIVDSDSINNFVDLYPFIKKNTTEIFFCRKIYTVLMSDLMKSYINSQEYREFDEKIISNIEWQSSDKLYNDEKIFEIYINGKNIAAIELYISLLATYKKDNLYLKIYKLSKLALNELELNYIQKLNVQLEMLLAMTLMGNFNDEKLEWSNNLEMLQIQLNNIERLKTLSDEDFAILYGTYCFIACRFHLAKSEYNRMKTITEDGLKKLISYNSEQAIDLQSKLCTNCAIAIKHIENIEKCVEYLECNDTISRNPKVAKTNTYIISYHTHNASLYTGNNPKAALGEFQKIKDICKEYTQEAYLHNLHNIASMEFVIGNYEEAEAEAKTVNKSAYEYNIQIEQGRSENLLASLCQVNGDLEKAKERYYKSYKFLKGISHNTHIWPPLVNLSALCLKSDDLINAEKYSNEATEFLIKNHCSQLKNAVVSKNKMPKIIVAILVLLDNYYHIDCEHSQIQYILSEVNSNDLENVFDEYIKKDLLLEYLDGTSYVCSGKLILKV